ncbi:MAG: hypothetical protein KIT09_28940 [Bryobacteraceae bacterium]|nr:hypothetical protein [Bryobacteraceae bacterium]
MPAAAAGAGIPRFELTASPLELTGPARPYGFINAVGERSGIWGFENGRLEAWVYPLKVFRDFHLTFQLDGSPTIYLGDETVRSVRVEPHMTQLIYATEQFSVVETLFAPRDEPGAVILLDVKASGPLRVTARFRPELNLMWPAAVGAQSSNWDAGRRWIRLSEPTGRFSALVGSPAAAGSNAAGYRPYLTDRDPYDAIELSISPEDARRNLIPIVIAGGIRDAYDAEATYAKLLKDLPALYASARQRYIDLERHGTEFRTPDPAVNQAMRWARVSLEQLRVCNPSLGCSYVSGYGSSGTGTRPMYAWFFDEPVVAAWSQLAYGDFEAVKTALRFIRKYQSEEGAVVHEISQSAAYIDWFRDYPFAYIHPDSPIWYIISLHNVFRFTGDREFLAESWPSIRKAYAYCLRLLDASDGLLRIPAGQWGSMETANFTKDAAMAGGWIAALRALRELGEAMGERDLAAETAERERVAAESLERRFWNEETRFYNYGLDLEGKPVTHLNPMIGYSAWFGALPERRARVVLEKLSAAAFLSDWGHRNMSLEDPRYEEGSYSMGSVWPFMTAGPMLAQYRYRNAAQGNLTWRAMLALRDLNARGAMPEALSGASYRLLDRGVPHQMFSEHVAIPGLVYGIFGLDLDVPRRTLRWAPQLPPGWPEAALDRFAFGADRLNLRLVNAPGKLTAVVESSSAAPVDLEFAPALPAGSTVSAVTLNGRPLPFTTHNNHADVEPRARATISGKAEIVIEYNPGVAVEIDWQPLLEGESSVNPRILRTAYANRKWEMAVEGRPGRVYTARLYTPWQPSVTAGGRIIPGSGSPHTLEFAAPEGQRAKPDKAGYVRWTVGVDLR